jgi:hypothetical protein
MSGIVLYLRCSGTHDVSGVVFRLSVVIIHIYLYFNISGDDRLICVLLRNNRWSYAPAWHPSVTPQLRPRLEAILPQQLAESNG